MEDNNFDSYSKSLEKFESGNSVPELEEKGKLTVNFNGPVIYNTNTYEKDEKRGILDNITQVIENGSKLTKIGTTLAAITAPVWAPRLALSTMNFVNQQLLKATHKDGIPLLPSSDKKEYFEKIQTEDNKFIIEYKNENNCPLLAFLYEINETLETGKKFKFSEENNFTRFFEKYLKRKENIIKYTEVYKSIDSKSNSTISNIATFNLYKNENKEFCFMITNLTKTVSSDYKEGESPSEIIQPELIK